jgi:hypothetical protein
LGDTVSYQGKSYKCVSPHTSIITWFPSIFTSTLWQPL